MSDRRTVTWRVKRLGGAIALLLAAGFIVFMFIQLLLLNDRRFDEMKAWPTTEGIILSSSASGIVGSNAPSRINTQVRFSYVVSGAEYQNEQDWSSTCEIGCREKAEDKREEYAPGERVPIYYDPDNVTAAVVNPKRTGLGDLVLLLGILTVFQAIGAIVGATKLVSRAVSQT
ncbi:MAG: DUF3592 domain-containing protein [Dehalococcoidia bacterium]